MSLFFGDCMFLGFNSLMGLIFDGFNSLMGLIFDGFNSVKPLRVTCRGIRSLCSYTLGFS
jgi:hypothetical protein